MFIYELHWLKNLIWTGVIPFHGFSMYGEYILHPLAFSSHTKLAGRTLQDITGSVRVWICAFCPTVAPLCFLYNEPSKLYSVFREMYIRYFFRLHSISSSPSVSLFGFCTRLLPHVKIKNILFVSVHPPWCMCLTCARVLLQGIVSLCLQFERLLQTHLPQLFYHLRQIGAQPRVARTLLHPPVFLVLLAHQ